MERIHLLLLLSLCTGLGLVRASSCTGFNCSEVPQGPDMGLIIGVVLGVGAVLFTGSLLYIWWRRRRIRNWQRNYVDTARARATAQTNYEQQHATVPMVEQHQQSAIAAQQREYDALQRQRDSRAAIPEPAAVYIQR